MLRENINCEAAYLRDYLSLHHLFQIYVIALNIHHWSVILFLQGQIELSIVVITSPPPTRYMYGVSRRYDGSRLQSVSCVRLWLNRPIRDAHCRPQTRHTKVTVFDEGWVAFRLSLFSLRALHPFFRIRVGRRGMCDARGHGPSLWTPRCCEARHMILVLP